MRLVQGPPAEIAREHGVSEACAERVAALRAGGLDVTAAVLALAGPGSPVEGLLSDPRLAADGAQLTPAALRSVARARGVPPEAGLAVIRREGRAALALAEEVVGGGAGLPVPAVVPTAVAVEPASAGALHREMLTLAAGVEEGERLRALRNLLATRLPAAERSGVLLFALRDESRRIRREALEALRRDGLPPEIADALGDLLSDRPAGRARAIASLSGAAPGLTGLPLAATLLTAGPLLRDEAYAGRERAGLLRLLGRLGLAAAREPRLLPDLLDLLLREAAAGPVEAAAALREGLRGLAAAHPPGLAARLLAEAERLAPGPARTAVLLALAELDPRPPERARADALLLGPELTRHLEVGEGGVPFRSYLVRAGPRLLPPLVARAGRERGERRAALIGLAGEVLRGSGVSPAGRRAAARALAALAADGEPGTAVALLRT
ncbi:MAG: hypothetical protein L0216_00430, partial [Planctomycetales bacterium]|nr:hypothetical protein [Planctomycetales bacterium]